VLRLGYFLEIRHCDVICTHFTINQNSGYEFVNTWTMELWI